MTNLQNAKRIAWFNAGSGGIRLGQRGRPGGNFTDEDHGGAYSEDELRHHHVRVLEEFPEPTTEERLAEATVVKFGVGEHFHRIAERTGGINEWAVYSYLNHVSSRTLATHIDRTPSPMEVLAKKGDS